MGKCTICGKGGLFTKTDPTGRCAACVVKIMQLEAQRAEEIRAEQRRKAAADAEREKEDAQRRAEQDAQRAEAERRRILRDEAARKADLLRPFQAPPREGGWRLSAERRAFPVVVPQECRQLFYSMPPRERLYMRFDPAFPGDRDSVMITHDGLRVGYVKRCVERDALAACIRGEAAYIAASRYCDGDPVIDLFFYGVTFTVRDAPGNAEDNPPVPESVNGLPRAYYYAHVGIFVPDENLPYYETLAAGTRVELAPEPSNPYDSAAIAVVSGDRIFGYMYKKGPLRDMVRDFRNRTDRAYYAALTTAVHDEPAIDLAFYKEKSRYAEDE